LLDPQVNLCGHLTPDPWLLHLWTQYIKQSQKQHLDPPQRQKSSKTTHFVCRTEENSLHFLMAKPRMTIRPTRQTSPAINSARMTGFVGLSKSQILVPVPISVSQSQHKNSVSLAVMETRPNQNAKTKTKTTVIILPPSCYNYFTLYKPASVRFTLNEHVRT